MNSLDYRGAEGQRHSTLGIIAFAFSMAPIAVLPLALNSGTFANNELSLWIVALGFFGAPPVAVGLGAVALFQRRRKRFLGVLAIIFGVIELVGLGALIALFRW